MRKLSDEHIREHANHVIEHPRQHSDEADDDDGDEGAFDPANPYEGDPGDMLPLSGKLPDSYFED